MFSSRMNNPLLRINWQFCMYIISQRDPRTKSILKNKKTVGNVQFQNTAYNHIKKWKTIILFRQLKGTGNINFYLYVHWSKIDRLLWGNILETITQHILKKTWNLQIVKLEIKFSFCALQRWCLSYLLSNINK